MMVVRFALTHLSKEIMERLGMWQRVPDNEIYQLKDAKVWNGDSSYQLHFPQPTQARKPTVWQFDFQSQYPLPLMMW